jgi:hypothetical protein
MNVIIYEKGSNKVKHFIKNCVKDKRGYVGDNKRVQISESLFDVVWTEDDLVPTFGAGGEILEWSKQVGEVIPSNEAVIRGSTSQQEYAVAIKIREFISTKSYQQVDNYIETNVTDLASAKVLLKELAKVILALSKIVDSK